MRLVTMHMLFNISKFFMTNKTIDTLYMALPQTHYSNYLDRTSITVYNPAAVPLLISRIPHCHYFSSVRVEYVTIIKDLMGVV